MSNKVLLRLKYDTDFKIFNQIKKMKNKEIIFKASFLLYFFAITIGVFFKKNKTEGADIIISLGLISYLTFIIHAIKEIKNTSVRRSVVWGDVRRSFQTMPG